MTLYILMRLKYANVIGLSFIGIGTIIVSIRIGLKFLVTNAWVTNSQTLFPTLFQYFWKKTKYNPAGPGAL